MPVAVRPGIRGTGRVHRLMRHRIKAVPAEYGVASPANQNMPQQFRQLAFAFLDGLEILLQIRWIDRHIRLVVLVEQLDLAVEVPRRPVPGCRRQQAASARRVSSHVVLKELVALRPGIAEVVALIDQNEIPVLEFNVV